MNKKPKTYDFSGWATKNDLRCSDGRTIRHGAFKDDDGKKVPLVWMHQHDDPENVIGHAILENRDEGVYAYCSFNGSRTGKQAKEVVTHGDVCSLSIWANNLTQSKGDVLHGSIKEVSVVLAGANPGAIIDFPILAHGEESETEAFIRVDEDIELYHEEPEAEHVEHADEGEKNDETGEGAKRERTVQDVLDGMTEEQLMAAKFAVDAAVKSKETGKQPDTEEAKKVDAILAKMTEEQKNVVAHLMVKAMESASKKENQNDSEAEHSDEEGEDFEMKMNAFEQYGENNNPQSRVFLSHSEGMEMLKYAREHGTSLKQLLKGWAEDNKLNWDELAHDDLGVNNISQLFPDFKLLNGPEPELMTTDQGWIGKVMAKVGKSPMSRLRVRFADVRDIENRRAKGYKKQTQKDFAGSIDLLGRTVDPITVYISSKLDHDDIVDITDFNIVNYMYKLDRMNLEEELARQIMIGDGRSGDKAIDKTKIIPIWTDDDLFTIHTVVDVASMRQTMNGSDSTKNFGDNYVYAEAIIQSLLYARENYKGKGNPDFFCTPHLVNVMLLARDLNGRRIYDNVNELKAALNVNDIITAEQFEGKTRTVTVKGDNNQDVTQTRGLLGIMVNLDDYKVGATRGGEITHFTDFDIRYNQEISLIETRCSGMLVRPYSAIALETVVS